MPRLVYLSGVGVALVALALAFTDWALSLQPGVTEANARRIRPGMTKGQVEAVFGGPWFSGVNGSLGWDITEPPAPDGYRYGWRSWQGPQGEAEVLFDLPTETVVTVTFSRRPGSNLLARLRAWLGWCRPG
jgi:hypothetical protein